MNPKLRAFLRPTVSLTGLIYSAGIVAAAATVGGFLDRFWWRFDLLAHFRVQYALALALMALFTLLLKKYRATSVFSLLALANLGLILPLYSGKPAPLDEAVPPLRAVLLNVRTGNRQYDLVKQFISQTDADFVVVEEVDPPWLEQLQSLTNLYPHIEACPRDDNFGIALLSRHPPAKSGITHIGPAYVPSVFGHFSFGTNSLLVFGTHPVPPSTADNAAARNDQLAAIPAFLAPFGGDVVLLGDLNVTPWCHRFKAFLRTSGLKNSAQGFGVQATWPAYLPPLLIPLDHCLHTPGIRIHNRHTGPYIGSDHFPVIVDFSVDDSRAGNPAGNGKTP